MKAVGLQMMPQKQKGKSQALTFQNVWSVFFYLTHTVDFGSLGTIRSLGEYWTNDSKIVSIFGSYNLGYSWAYASEYM